MRTYVCCLRLAAWGALFALVLRPVHAQDYYVARAGQTPSGNHTTWTSAASNIADAVALAAGAAGSTVWVSNSVYTLSTPITVGDFTVRSYNNGNLDREGTIIDGDGVTRCFTLNNAAAVVRGFTITNGYAVGSGGGAFISAGTLDNCLLVDNTATNTANSQGGGGVYAAGANSVITNCELIRNVSFRAGGNPGNGGGGAMLTSSAKLLNSRLLHNVSPHYWTAGGGVHMSGGALVQNCEVISNRLHDAYGFGPSGASGFAGGGIYISGGTVRNTLVAHNGAGASNFKCASGIASHSNNGGLIENCTIVGNHWNGLGGYYGNHGWVRFTVKNTIAYYNQNLDMYRGYHTGGSVLGTLVASNSCAALTNEAYISSGTGNTDLPPAFVDYAGGDFRLHPWSVGVDAGLTLGWTASDVDLAGQPRISGNGLVDLGPYETTAAAAPSHYVAQDDQTPVSPYTSWATAATNLHQVMEVAYEGSTVRIAPGTYQLTNQVVVGNRSLRSDNGGALDAEGTIIRGAGYAPTPITNRCFYLNSYSAVVQGLTISNGYVRGAGVYPAGVVAEPGGGVNIQNGTLDACIVTGNTATNAGGGGVYATGSRSLVTNCRVIANGCWWGDSTQIGNAGGGGVRLDDGAQLVNSLILQNQSPMYAGAGGAVRAGANTLIANCNIISNTANDAWAAGGVWFGGSGNTLRNCVIMGSDDGRGTRGAGIGAVSGVDNTIENCTIVGNAGHGIGANSSGGPTYRIWNTINYFNTFDTIYAGSGGTIIASNACVTSTNNFSVGSSGNITNNPAFAGYAGGNYRLVLDSPCRNAGVNRGWMTEALDLDGNTRISGGTVDIGAYEYIVYGTIITVR